MLALLFALSIAAVQCHLVPTTSAALGSTSGGLRGASSPGMCKAHYNMLCHGQDIRDAGVANSEQECCEICTSTLGCNIWTWKRGADKHCWLKTGCTFGTPDDRFVSGTVSDAPPMPKHGKNGEPVYDSIDLAATYFETKKIFARMGLSVQDMTALIGAGHCSPNASLTGGEFYGQWVPLGTGKEMGMQYFQFLTAHGRGWCAVNAGGSALFVSGGPHLSQPADKFSPIGPAANCVESVENKSVYGSPDAKLPMVDPSKLIKGNFPGPSGAAAMLPTDFMLQYSPETYQHVMEWAGNGEKFWAAFLEGWQKLTENGVQRLCPEINSTNATVADYCVTDLAAKANYFSIWGHIKDEVKRNLTQIPESCRSTNSTYCLPSVFRMGFHVSGTFDPNPVNGSTNYAFGLHGGSEGPCFLGLCSEYDGCGGCLSKTIQAVIKLGESLQYKYPEVIVSVPDILILAASVAVELLTPQWRIRLFRWRVPFRPGRKLYNISDLGVSRNDTISACMELGGRLPGPAYMGRTKATYTNMEEEVIGNMLSTDVNII